MQVQRRWTEGPIVSYRADSVAKAHNAWRLLPRWKQALSILIASQHANRARPAPAPPLKTWKKLPRQEAYRKMGTVQAENCGSCSSKQQEAN